MEELRNDAVLCWIHPLGARTLRRKTRNIRAIRVIRGFHSRIWANPEKTRSARREESRRQGQMSPLGGERERAFSSANYARSRSAIGNNGATQGGRGAAISQRLPCSSRARGGRSFCDLMRVS